MVYFTEEPQWNIELTTSLNAGAGGWSGERWGGLVTREAYRDYRLVVEFCWGRSRAAS